MICQGCGRRSTTTRDRFVSNLVSVALRRWCDRCARAFERVEPLQIIEDAL